MSSDFVLACVGKPSAGKSSFLNAVTDAVAKVGNYPFTTIRPNHGVAYYPIQCPCVKYGKQSVCQPRYGRCIDGTRYVPISIMDVAGLVPGASHGQGLGNQFLDDLRSADVLVHVVDVSGTTDEGGKETTGYNPINDIDWLHGEVHEWIFNNLNKKWSGIVRRHTATKSSVVETLHNQFSGYGATQSIVAKFMDKSGLKDPLETWDEDTLHKVVDAFLDVRFPTIVALNKIDLPDSDKNIAKIMRKYDEDRLVLTSALSECFLRKMDKQGYIKYKEGTDEYLTLEDDPDSGLKPLDEKIQSRLEKIQDLVLFRYGSTGVEEVITRAVETLGVIPVYPVRNLSNFSNGQPGKQGGAFRDCIMVRPGTTVREFAKKVHPEIDKHYLYAETVGNIRLGESDIITEKINIISFKTSAMATSSNTSNSTASNTTDKKK
ncbi:P-loop containing nucleoside triphosphate hydrolase protein [Basidiobolus meristosporus CBS 931.73]|uniref:p-loop containing nucleoside triphosphate hydrolase protein n=1 Tax=Basidiobolus meristosporus CBS 931.73 TaxID=1314790 RepID=A0A1Y1Z5F9_9FUNG|nr:P-loop containing nucleoside triphosphate hydrolase protein [Basidiobolus meristosporus CBS 931.73]|eukprot:ORY05528.1 P-loop containing nucleoside triphosphate hydrolase protein [Basidiobolus meristosporus CBS 931.73]